MNRQCVASLFLIVLFAAACEPGIEVGPEDRGMMVREGLELHPWAFPATVSCGDGMDCEALEQAAQWWHDELSQPYHVGEALFVEEVNAFEVAPGGWITVSVGELPPGVLGQAVIDFDAEGAIIHAEVVLQAGEWEASTLRHELGHCLGLEDDEPSLDLDSIMSSPTPLEGRVTESDRAEVTLWH